MTKKLFFKQPYLNQVLDGEKDLEGRVGYKNIKNISVGETILVQGKHPFRVASVRRFKTFREVVSDDNYNRMIPDANSLEETLQIYERIYPLNKQKALGVYIFKLEMI